MLRMAGGHVLFRRKTGRRLRRLFEARILPRVLFVKQHESVGPVDAHRLAMDRAGEFQSVGGRAGADWRRFVR